MTQEEFQNVVVGDYLIPADRNSMAEGAYTVIAKTHDGELVAIKTAFIGSQNKTFWETTKSERLQ